MSVYCLLYQQDIPATVTIDEAVDISKTYGTADSYRFVNGVLDGVRKKLLLPGKLITHAKARARRHLCGAARCGGCRGALFPAAAPRDRLRAAETASRD